MTRGQAILKKIMLVKKFNEYKAKQNFKKMNIIINEIEIFEKEHGIEHIKINQI